MQQKIRDLVNSGRYDHEDFTVALQPFYEGVEVPEDEVILCVWQDNGSDLDNITVHVRVVPILTLLSMLTLLHNGQPTEWKTRWIVFCP